MRNLILTLFIGLSLAGLCGCEEGDDQTVVPADRLYAANPAPTVRNFKTNNIRHQVLIAVIDSGVDYNHSTLADSIHFNLNTEGQPIGVGYDFIGADVWPSPYIATSVDQNREASEDAVAEGVNVIRNTSIVRQMLPELSPFFNPDRRLDQEIGSGAYHGTHVAGLLAYDEPKLGLLIYRLLPNNIRYKNGKRIYGNGTADFIDLLDESIQHAVQSGARVINLSLGVAERSSGFNNDMSSEEMSIYQARLEALAAKFQNVAFVAAAGNQGAWIDQRTRRHLPCGVRAQNFLCVGAIDTDGGLAHFSNIVLADVPYLAAAGQDIISTYPLRMCQSDRSFAFLHQSDSNFPWADQDDTKQMIDGWKKLCEAPKGFAKLSGTSMASPIAARMVGKVFLNEPNLTGEQAIRRLMEQTMELSIGRNFSIRRLRVERPSWYPWFHRNEGFKFFPSSPEFTADVGSLFEQTGYFEFFSSK